jgi:hypothetical protein
MGFFSWKTQDTDRSISNAYSSRKPFKVVMHDNKGNKWVENEYEGYGEFGGKDYYDLLAEMNGYEADRGIGIELAFGKEPYITPNLTETEDWQWVDEEPENCPDQGYFYDDGCDDEEE